MANLRVVGFSNPYEFLEAVKGNDDSFMNFPLGALMDSMDEQQIRVRNITEDSRTLVGVYDGDALVLALVKVVGDFAWVLGCPGDSEPVGPNAKTAISLLVSFLPSIIDPKLFDNLFGPESLVDAFIDAWVSGMTARGLRIEALPTFFRSKASFATLATLPLPSLVLSKYRIELASPDNVEILAHLYTGFSGSGPNAASIGEARVKMDMSIQLREIWVCREQGEIAGYIATGRTTFRTVAIRNLYVSPRHRRKGVAEAMTVAVMRYFLGAQPLGFGGAPDGPPTKGIKEEICLNVAEEHVQRLYKRCGFLLGEGSRDPTTGKKGWFASAFRGVRFLDELE
ncbi:uncharacterized protein PHACADRAFT_208796 [Phanerochaete carnosa HHB-10118-sp]|uniref:N-acetyltransferase domain-containing protein n=1 Tax=Phanerochaete carnosa (strain HHB-10118-sp) TaxID=650164 RepID=K5WXR3_PHACS|nr:uncharacterized protein PHACADRAFT_208796 [Phanerochaete carnosa HHB-10118-sp]EKM55282.1 hypothetical protein PHACADRAFT_208796 [Phanerochaete carnosa HHB-10118-sp]